MVSIKSFKVITNDDGEDYCILILEGKVEMAKSSSTGKFYATTKTCNVPTTFDEEKCKDLIGSTMPGSIERVETDPYDYTIPGSDKTVQLTYTYEYNPIENVGNTVLTEPDLFG